MKKFLIIIVLIVVFAAGLVYLWLYNTAPKYSGVIKCAGIHDSTQVVYDSYGVPHIYASNANAAYFALGYAQAQDRLFQMEILRRLSQGRLAEILGPKLLPVDKKMRTLGFNKMAKESALYSFANDGEMQQQTHAYLSGINAFIKKGNLPIEFKLLGFKPNEFSPKDIYSNIGYMALGFSIAMTTEPVMEYISENLGENYLTVFESDSASGTSNYRPYAVKEIIANTILKDIQKFPYDLPFPYWEGSNSWLLSKSKTKSKHAIFANDTHIGYSQPSVWYEAYMDYPGHKLYGYYLAAVPFAIMGHNTDLAWGLTIFPMDNMDLYYETTNPKNSNQYRQGSKWVNYSHYKQTIKVKDSAAVEYDVRWTKHGPVISDAFSQVKQKNSNVVALWWTLNHIRTKVLKAIYLMNNATNISTFEQALPNIDILGLNVMYADRKDNIAWWATGLIPMRKASLNTKLYLSGAMDTLERNYYPFNKNPHLINPDKGYIVTANNSPGIYDSMSVPGYYAPGYRAARITELLEQNNSWDIQRLKKVQLDVFSHRDLHIRDIILNSMSTEEKMNPKNKEIIAALKKWDGNYYIKSVGATIITRLIYETLNNSLGKLLDKERFDQMLHTYAFKCNLERLIEDKDSPWWQGRRQQIFDTSMAQTLHSLTKQLGSDISQWQWGKVHQLEHVHPIGRKKPFDKIFNVGPFPVRGSLEVVDKEGFVYSDKAKIKVVSGPAMRCLLDFAKADSAIAIIPTGQSGNIMSSHYSDQSRMFVRGEYRQQIIKKSELNVDKNSLWLIPE